MTTLGVVLHNVQGGQTMADNYITDKSQDEKQTDTVKSVTWGKAAELDAEVTILTGTLTVATALTAAFAYFVLSGVNFHINRAPVGGTTIDFTYSGDKSAAAIKAFFAKNDVQILLSP
jgi:hypothetical protein